MLGTVLEFAPGTTEDCQRLAFRLFQKPGVVLRRYRAFRQQFGTSDLVLETEESDPSRLKGMTREHYVDSNLRSLGRGGAKLAAVLGVDRSAHQVASLPAESDAFWLIINRRDELPVMIVLFAAPYATEADAREPAILE